MTTSNRLERLKNLSPEKRLLLLKALREEAAIAEESNTIPRRSQLNPCPLSFAQQRLWFLDQLSPGNPAYNLPAAVSLKGQLNIATLEKTFQEIIQRHQVLRTNFALVDGEAVQVISDTATFTLPIINLQAFAETQQAEIQRLAVEEAQIPFDLTKGLLLRGKLLQLSDSEYVLLFTMHHIISDGWSMGVLVREVAALYPAFCTAKPYPLPELPIQYADFAVWQRQYLQGEELNKQLTYWKQQLSGTLPVLELPTDRVRPTVPTFKGSQHLFVLPLSLTEAIKNLCQQEDVTLFMALLAGFQTLLYGYAKQEDIRVGSPIANRNRVELEGLIGFFVNTLVLRADLSGNPSFREMLVRSRQVCLQAYAHPELPFEKLVQELQPERNLNYNSLFQVWFVLQNTPIPSLELPSLTLTPLDIDSGTTRHDLSLNLWEIPQGIQGCFEYKTDLFDPATITRMAEYLEMLLSKIVAQPDVHISDLAAIISEAESQYQFNQEQELKQSSIHKLRMTKRKSISSL
ncbi:MAG TPA: condensation domain-containing protein [Oculatellaceae cyanobacterium]